MPKAIVFPEVDRVELREVEHLPLQNNDVRVACEFSGVSQGTEVWALAGKRRELSFPTIPGYQAVGTITEVGDEVRDYKVGDRLLYHTARQPEGVTETWMGAHMSEAVVSLTQPTLPTRVPAAADPRTACLAAMPAVAQVGHSMIRVDPGDLVVVFGQGLIGQGSAMFSRLRGGIVITTDLSTKRLELSRRVASNIAIDPTKDDLDRAVRSIKPEGADVVIDTTGRASMFETAVGLLRPRGTICLQGWYPDPIQFDFHETHLKLPTIVTPCGIGDTALVLDLLAHGRLDWGPLITDVASPADAPRLYQSMREGGDLLGVVFDWSQS